MCTLSLHQTYINRVLCKCVLPSNSELRKSALNLCYVYFITKTCLFDKSRRSSISLSCFCTVISLTAVCVADQMLSLILHKAAASVILARNWITEGWLDSHAIT